MHIDFNTPSCKTHPFIVVDGISYSYESFFQKVNAFANELEKIGISMGKIVAFPGKASLEIIALIFALLKIRAICCPLNSFDTQNLLQEKLARLEDPIFLEEQKIKEIFSQGIPSLSEFDLDATCPAFFLFTSGSTGKGKIAALSLRNFYYSALGSNEIFKLESDDRWLLALPLFHVGGLSILFRTLLAKSTITINSSSLQESILDPSIQRFSLVPTQLFRLLDQKDNAIIHALQSKKSLLIGGAGIATSLWEQITEFDLPVYTTWGMTEMASQITMGRKKTYSAGTLLPYRECKVDSSGELLVRGETLFLGYYTKETGISLQVDQNGYFATKDLGFFDDQGCLAIKGRKDLMFISLGEKIHPEEIEKVLKEIRSINEAIVVPVEDKERGKRPFAFVDSDESWDEKTLQNFLKERISSLKVPIRIYSLPKNENSLKPNRKLLEQKANALLEIERTSRLDETIYKKNKSHSSEIHL